MQSTRIAPNRTRLLGPVHSRNAVVVPRDQPEHIIANDLVLIRVHVVDPTDVQPNASEERFPPCDRVRADNRVHGGEVQIDIQRRTTRRHDFVPSRFSGGLEHGLGTGCGQSLEEGLHGWREAVVTVFALADWPSTGARGGKVRYSSYPETQSVSPPAGGVSCIRRKLKSAGHSSKRPVKSVNRMIRQDTAK